MILGSIITSIVLTYNHPRMLFSVRGFFYFMAFVQGYFMNKDLDTNQKASMKDAELIAFENL